MELGFSDFRVRLTEGGARLQVTGEQMPLVFEKREEVMAALKPLFGTVLLDLEQRSPSVSVKGGR